MLALPSDAVTVIVAFAAVGSVYEVDAWPLLLVTAGFGLNVPPRPPSLKLIDAPETVFPEEFLAVITIGSGSVVPTVPVCRPPEVTVKVVTTAETAVSVNVIGV